MSETLAVGTRVKLRRRQGYILNHTQMRGEIVGHTTDSAGELLYDVKLDYYVADTLYFYAKNIIEEAE